MNLSQRPAGAYDPYQRDMAARMQQERAPWWVIWWGVGSRRYWAVPLWEGAPVSLVNGRTPNELTEAMHAAANATMTGSGA